MTPANAAHEHRFGRRLSRSWWLVVGFAAVGVGSIGIVVPGLPTTVFFIAAAWCFHRSSPRFERWVLGLPRIGPMVADHRAGLGMPRRAKRFALATMWIAVSLSAFATRADRMIASIIVVAGLVGTVYIVWRVPTRERVLASRDLPSAI
jgi:uncharacterized protein